jgi:hypothetical protein
MNQQLWLPDVEPTHGLTCLVRNARYKYKVAQ